MRNKIYIAASFSFIISIILLLNMYRYYSGPDYYLPYNCFPRLKADTLNIAYIGDSWAYMHKNHNCQIKTILEKHLHRPVEIYSYGIPGLTSKEIYENLFHGTLRTFMQARHYEFCYISAGINDANLKMSTSYYTHSMDYIIQFMLANNIQPIIQEIPDFDIHSAYYRLRNIKKIRIRLSSLLTNSPIDCKQIFRDALVTLIREKKYDDNVIIIHYSSWNKNHLDDWEGLYKEDRMHLNEKGYTVLDSIISAKIIQTLNTNLAQPSESLEDFLEDRLFCHLSRTLH